MAIEPNSDRSLIDKLGIREGMKIIILNAPLLYERQLGDFPESIERKIRPRGMFDLIQFFALNRHELELKFEWLKQHTKPDGILWISWLKKSTGFVSDLSEETIRNIGQRHGMTDSSICSLDDWWFGMKFSLAQTEVTDSSG